MTAIKLDEEENKRLKKIEDAFDEDFTHSVWKRFNKASALHDAFTPAESKEQMDLVKQSIKEFAAGAESSSTASSLKICDIFCRAALRVGSDAKIASLLTSGKFDKQDVTLLEKCEFKSIAALVKAKLQA